MKLPDPSAPQTQAQKYVIKSRNTERSYSLRPVTRDDGRLVYYIVRKGGRTHNFMDQVAQLICGSAVDAWIVSQHDQLLDARRHFDQAVSLAIARHEGAETALSWA